MEAVHGDRVLGGTRLGMEAPGRGEHAVDHGRIDAYVAEIAEADVGEGLVELARHHLVAVPLECDDREGLAAGDVDRRIHQFVLLTYLTGTP
jgi:hypothetical protein